MIVNSRRQRKRFQFPLRPMWAEVFLSGLGCFLIMGAVLIANIYYWPIGIIRKQIKAGLLEGVETEILIGHGVAIPVLIAICVAIVMTFLATRTRFGRYVFALGGNPEANGSRGYQTRAG